MGVIKRGVVFSIGTVSNAILFLFHSRVILEVVSVAGDLNAKAGPASGAFDLLPTAIQLGIGGIQIGLILYLLGGLGEERARSRRPMP